MNKLLFFLTSETKENADSLLDVKEDLVSRRLLGRVGRCSRKARAARHEQVAPHHSA